jgi:hypothetical protein
MSNEETNKIKLKIICWLKEEGFSAEETEPGPNAHFIITASKAELAFNVMQDFSRNESIFICANVLVGPEERRRLQKTPIKRRLDFVWALNMDFIKNNELGDFAILPDPPADIQSIFVSTRQLYYDELTKGKFMVSAHVLLKATVMIMWMLQKLLGIPLSSLRDKETKLFTTAK